MQQDQPASCTYRTASPNGRWVFEVANLPLLLIVRPSAQPRDERTRTLGERSPSVNKPAGFVVNFEMQSDALHHRRTQRQIGPETARDGHERPQDRTMIKMVAHSNLSQVANGRVWAPLSEFDRYLSPVPITLLVRRPSVANYGHRRPVETTLLAAVASPQAVPKPINAGDPLH